MDEGDNGVLYIEVNGVAGCGCVWLGVVEAWAGVCRDWS